MFGKSWEPEAEAREGDRGWVVPGTFVVTGGQGPVLLESAEAAFDDVALSVGVCVDVAAGLAAADASVDLVDPFGDRRCDSPSPQAGTDPVG
ncbi:hypothetical protein GCM10010417_49920 [Streptomyces carpaticus]